MTFEEYKKLTHFKYLDGIRAIAILCVIYHHVHLKYAPTGFDFGHFGVQIFFVLSGFLITTLLLRERESTGTISLKKFYMRRTLRIFPVYYLVLGIYCLLVFFVEKDPVASSEFWHNLPFFLTYTYNLVIPEEHGRVIFFLAWSLATEEQYYLVWPFLVKYLKVWSILVMGILAILLEPVSKAICVGSVLAFILNSSQGYNALYRIFGFLRHTSFLLNAKIVTMVGVVSYGIYLTHGLTMRVIGMVLPPAPLPIFIVYTIVTSFCVALLLYKYFEKPFLRLKKRFDAVPTRRVADAPRIQTA